MAEGEFRQKAFPGMVMRPVEKPKENPDLEYLRTDLAPHNMRTKEEIERQKVIDTEKEKQKKKHPWKVKKGAYAYGSRWSEGHNEVLGIFPDDVLLYEVDRKTDGPYFSVGGFVISPTEEQKRKLQDAGLGSGALYVIKQSIKGKKTTWIGNYREEKE